MGAFFLHHEKTNILQDKLLYTFQKKGFVQPTKFKLGAYNLYLFKKQLINKNNFVRNNNAIIFACGSLVYKKRSYADSLSKLLTDLNNNILDYGELYGNFILIFYNYEHQKFMIIPDPAFTKSIYFDAKRKIISSDFLAINYSYDTNYSMNKLAIVENLITGHLIGPDTYSQGIKKLDKKNIDSLHEYFPEISFRHYNSKYSNFINRTDAINHANVQLEEYFSSIRSLTEEYGVHIGLTGGFDSRLLLMHANKKLNNLIINSFWRPNSTDYKIAKEISRVIGLPFFSFEDQSFENPDLNRMIQISYWFQDGQVRSQNRWDENFNLPEYAMKLANNHLVGFHGYGGEQYRNADGISTIPFNSYVLYEWMFQQGRDPFIDKKMKMKIFEYIRMKIIRLIGHPGRCIDLRYIKKIQNEIWNTANRNTRLNNLNQLMFYFAPFSEYPISHPAYEYVPWIGNSASFQIDMMKKLDIQMASMPSNYGYSIQKCEPLRFRIVPIFKRILPPKLFHELIQSYKKTSLLDTQYLKTDLKHTFFEEIGEKIDLDMISTNKHLAAGLNSMDYTLQKLF